MTKTRKGPHGRAVSAQFETGLALRKEVLGEAHVERSLNAANNDFDWPLQEIVTDTTLHIGSFTINGAFLGGVLLPGFLLALMTAWPWLDKSPGASAGVWFARTRRRQNAVFLLLVLGVLVLTVIGTFLRGPYWHFYWPWQPWPELPSRI